MQSNLERVAALAAKPLGCKPEDVLVQGVTPAWSQRTRTYLARGPKGGSFDAGLLVVLPGATHMPPLVLATEPVWDQIWPATALMRAEELDASSTPPRVLADFCRAALAGPGARLATPDLAERELRDRTTYRALAPYCREVELTHLGKQWLLRFCAVAPDDAIEAWQVSGYGPNVSQGECNLWCPPETWPKSPRRRGG